MIIRNKRITKDILQKKKLSLLFRNQSEVSWTLSRTPGTHSTNGFWLKLYEIIFSFKFHSNDPIRPYHYTCHDSTAVVTRANLWHGIIIFMQQQHTVRCHYTAVNFSKFLTTETPIARTSGRNMGCHFGVQSGIRVIAMLYMISWYIGPRYKGARV